MEEQHASELLHQETKQANAEEEGVGHREEEQEEDGDLNDHLQPDETQEEVGRVLAGMVVVGVVVERAVQSEVAAEQDGHGDELGERLTAPRRPHPLSLGRDKSIPGIKRKNRKREFIVVEVTQMKIE